MTADSLLGARAARPRFPNTLHLIYKALLNHSSRFMACSGPLSLWPYTSQIFLETPLSENEGGGIIAKDAR